MILIKENIFGELYFKKKKEEKRTLSFFLGAMEDGGEIKIDL